ncbi:MAG TPA: YqgE/AlgH family protein [Xanthobacteraceae bacterium]
MRLRDLNGRRWLSALAAMLVSATILHAALPPDADTSGPTSLTGQFLIASPQMRGSAFAQTVILLAQHNRDGALGIVINRPIDRRSIASLLEALGADASGVNDSVRIFLGGPVSPDTVFVVHSADYHSADTLDIDGRVALSSGPDVLRDIGLGKGPRKRLVAFGYAGWASQQLDDELARGDWYTEAEDPVLVFDDDRSKVWADALARHNTDR